MIVRASPSHHYQEMEDGNFCLKHKGQQWDKPSGLCLPYPWIFGTVGPTTGWRPAEAPVTCPRHSPPKR